MGTSPAAILHKNLLAAIALAPYLRYASIIYNWIEIYWEVRTV